MPHWGTRKTLGIAAVCLLTPVLVSCADSTSSSPPSEDPARRALPADLDRYVPDDLAYSVDQGIEDLKPADIAFNHPPTLRLDETVQIQAVASFDKDVAELQGMLTEIGRPQGARIEASNVMVAQLAGGDFNITPLSPAEQALGSGVTEWRWEIEPKEVGKLNLHLTMSAVLLLDAAQQAGVPPREVMQQVETFNRTLTVKAVPKASQSWPEDVMDFVGDNWQFFVTTAIALFAAIPVLLLLLPRRRDSPRSVGDGGSAGLPAEPAQGPQDGHAEGGLEVPVPADDAQHQPSKPAAPRQRQFKR